MNAINLKKIFRARIAVFLIVFLAVFSVAVAYYLLAPRKYIATASIVVEVRPDPISGIAPAGMLANSIVATQADIIGSARVTRNVIRAIGLEDNPDVKAQWQDATNGDVPLIDWLASFLQEGIDVRPSRDSSVIAIDYQAADPKFAAAMATAYARSYIETNLELKVAPAKQYAQFFEKRTGEARRELEKAQGALNQFQKENNVNAGGERYDLENARLADLSNQLVGLEALYADSRSRAAQIVAKSDQMAETINNPAINGLKQDLARNEGELSQLRTRLGESHPQVVEMKAKVEAAKLRLESESNKVAGSANVTANVNAGRLAELRGSIAAQKEKISGMKNAQDTASLLRRDVENAQRIYDALVARQSQSAMEGQAQMGNVSILSEATAPTKPASPKAIKTLVGGFSLALLAALAITLLMEILDTRIRTVEQIEELNGLKVLGSLDLSIEPGQTMRNTARIIHGRRLLGHRGGN